LTVLPLLKINGTLADFWDALGIWSQATFGTDAERGPLGPIKHLRKECDEALAKPDDIVEYADMVFLVFDACRRAGFTYEELEAAIWAKLAVNQKRTWGPKSSDGVTEHIRSGE
jgi:hypothetical protein